MATFNSLFTSRSMVRAVEQWKQPMQFLLGMFFSETITHKTRVVEIDFTNEGRRIAPFVHRKASGNLVEKTGYEKFFWEPPYVKPKTNIEPEDLQETLPGETIYDDPGSRIIELRNRILFEQERMIQRREELMAKQILFDKSIPITNENGDAIQDAIVVTREAELDYNATPWTGATAKPLEDVENSKRLISKHTGLIADICVMGSSAANAFESNTTVLARLDNLRTTIGGMTYERMKAMGLEGAIFLGRINDVDYYRYDEFYKDPATGVETALIPASKALLGCTRARAIRHYGAIHTLVGPLQARRWPKFYENKDQDPEVMGIQTHSAPLILTHQPNAYSVLTVV